MGQKEMLRLMREMITVAPAFLQSLGVKGFEEGKEGDYYE